MSHQKEIEKKEMKKEDSDFIKNVLNMPEKKPAPPPPKNRDLINPNKKRRKQQGMKIGSDF